MKGRKNTPNVLKLIRGETSPSRVNKSQPRYAPADAKPPAFLGETAKAKWAEVVPLLGNAGVLCTINTTTMARYCIDWERYCEAVKDVEENGAFYVTEAGLRKRNPADAAASELSRLLLAFEAEFGMTPASSARVKTVGAQEEDESFA